MKPSLVFCGQRVTGSLPVTSTNHLPEEVVSMGRRNTFLKFTRRSLKT